MYAFKKTLITLPLLLAGAIAQAEVAANIGVTSDYIWRGVSQSGGTASVSGGVDYSDESGFYAGTWVGSLNNSDSAFNGSEVDLYAGYATDIFDVGYIYYAYPSNDSIDFGEVYGSLTLGAFTAGLAYTLNNSSGNDGAQFAEGDLYYYASASADIAEDWSAGFTVGSYSYDLPANDGSALDDYIHYSVDFATSTEIGDFTLTLTDSDADGEDVTAVVSWAIGF